MRPREDDPELYRSNVLKSWQIMSHVVRHLEHDCFVIHDETPEGVGYDNLCLVTLGPRNQLSLQFRLNRNGINSSLLSEIWRKVDDEGPGAVGDLLLEQLNAPRRPEPRETDTSWLCAQVVSWINEHRNEVFFVGPPDWPGSCRELLEVRADLDGYTNWPFHEQSPEISCGLGGVEIVRFAFGVRRPIAGSATSRINGARRPEKGTKEWTDLDSALNDFEQRRGIPFTTADRHMVTNIGRELGLTEFRVRSDEKLVTDRKDILHIHPTMIVARQHFSGSTERRTPYPDFPHFIELHGWTGRTHKASNEPSSFETNCPRCFQIVPVGSECTEGGRH